jgi:hypothetical protein
MGYRLPEIGRLVVAAELAELVRAVVDRVKDCCWKAAMMVAVVWSHPYSQYIR